MVQATPPQLGIDAPNPKLAGYVMAICAALAVLAVVNHPQATAHSRGELMTQLAALGPMDRAVHGVLMLFLFAIVWSLSVFCIKRGFTRATVLAGFIAYVTGAAAWIGATLIDGFITPAIADRYVNAASAAQDSATSMLALCAITIQILTKFGLVAISIGILKWSSGLLLSPGAPRTVGIIGIFAGLLPPVGVLATGIHLSPHSLAVIVIMHAIWYVGIAFLLVRDRL